MNIFEATKACFVQYATFSGRARRAELWWFTLVVWLVSFALGSGERFFSGKEYAVSSLVWSLLTFVPGLAVGSRRLHDTGRSGWWQLLIFLPVIGWIGLTVFWAEKGASGPNRFGPDPLRGDRAAAFN